VGDGIVTVGAAGIEVRGLSVAFGGRPALLRADLAVPHLGITVAVGPSGAGKSTLLRAVNRLNDLLPGSRTEGTVRVLLDGRMRDVREPGLRPEVLRRRVSLVFQVPQVLPFSVRRNLSIPLEAALGLPRSAVEARSEEALRGAGLWEEVRDGLDRPAADLSGGQQQRLCLARALALQPDVLLLDEPTANLDARSASIVEETLLSLRGRLTILAVSHSLPQAERLGGRPSSSPAGSDPTSYSWTFRCPSSTGCRRPS